MRRLDAAGVIVMAVLLALWLAFTLWYAVVLFTTGDGVAIAMGVALVVLPLIGGWWLALEIRFLVRGQRLLRRLGDEGALPVDDLPHLPSGRVDPEAGKAVFGEYQRVAEAEDADWRAWARLALAYDAAGDRAHARWAMREAIRRASPPA